MKPLDTPLSPSAPSGLEKNARLPRRKFRSILLSLDVPRSLGSCVPLQDVGSRRELRNALTKHRLLSRMPPRKNAP